LSVLPCIVFEMGIADDTGNFLYIVCIMHRVCIVNIETLENQLLGLGQPNIIPRINNFIHSSFVEC